MLRTLMSEDTLTVDADLIKRIAPLVLRNINLLSKHQKSWFAGFLHCSVDPRPLERTGEESWGQRCPDDDVAFDGVPEVLTNPEMAEAVIMALRPHAEISLYRRTDKTWFCTLSDDVGGSCFGHASLAMAILCAGLDYTPSDEDGASLMAEMTPADACVSLPANGDWLTVQVSELDQGIGVIADGEFVPAPAFIGHREPAVLITAGSVVPTQIARTVLFFAFQSEEGDDEDRILHQGNLGDEVLKGAIRLSGKDWIATRNFLLNQGTDPAMNQCYLEYPPQGLVQFSAAFSIGEHITPGKMLEASSKAAL